MVVEGDDTIGRPRQVGGDEADTWIKLTRMPLDLRHDMARLSPTLRLMEEAGVVPAHLMRRSPDGRLSRYPILAGSRIA
jgi:hypothetical protein